MANNSSKVKDLIIHESGPRKGYKEFNHLRVTNLDDFFESYVNNVDFYASPFKILYDLETEVKFKNSPDQTILIPYKDEGDIIFDLVDIREESGVRIVEYEYASIIS